MSVCASDRTTAIATLGAQQVDVKCVYRCMVNLHHEDRWREMGWSKAVSRSTALPIAKTTSLRSGSCPVRRLVVHRRFDLLSGS